MASFQYEIKTEEAFVELGQTILYKYIIVWQINDVGITRFYEGGAQNFYNVPDDIVKRKLKDWVIELYPEYSDLKNMTEKTSPKYTYKIEDVGTGSKIIYVYEDYTKIFEQIWDNTEDTVMLNSAVNDLKNKYPGVTILNATNSSSTISPTPLTGPSTVTPTGITAFNMPSNTQDLKDKKKELKGQVKKLQKIGLPSVNQIGQQIWENMIKPRLLTQRQIAKKMIMVQGAMFNPPVTEENAQLIVYGKVYYKDGKLYDNDLVDPACISVPTDKDYQPPMDENHPTWQKIENMIQEAEDSLEQLGIKLAEFMFAQPAAIATIVISLVSLVSSLIIMPPGSGLPTALTSVQTMLKTIKDLQAKTAEILPLLGILDFIALLLPKEAQAIIVQINVIIGIYLGTLTVINTILGMLDTVTSALKGAQDTMENTPVKVEPKAEELIVDNKKNVKLSVQATNGSWSYSYEWTDKFGNKILRDLNSTGNDDGVRIIPYPTIGGSQGSGLTTEYTCKVTDIKKQTTQEATVSFLII